MFIRWAQVGAFSPLMENGGNGEHRPWGFDEAHSTRTTDLYRRYVSVHYELVPYLLAAGSRALETGRSAMTPIASHEDFIHRLIDDFRPSTYDYLLGDDIYVAPVLAPNVTQVEVRLPVGRWTSFWNTSVVLDGGRRHMVPCTLDELPVFRRHGAWCAALMTAAPTHGRHRRRSAAQAPSSC